MTAKKETMYNLLSDIKVNYSSNNKYAYSRYNKLSLSILFLLYKEGLIVAYRIYIKKVRITLKYYQDKPLINKIKNFAKAVSLPISSLKIKNLSKECNYYIASTNDGIVLVDKLNLFLKKEGGYLLFGLNTNF
jgi:ribosomal protein S8